METFSATTIFWLIVLGTTTGWIVGYLIGREGTSQMKNLIWGVVGSVLTGLIGLILNLSGVLLFALMGTLAILFLANVFHLHHEEDVYGDIKRGIQIKRK